MHTNIFRRLRIVAVALFVGATGTAISTKQSFADVQLENEDSRSSVVLRITNRISKNDADYVAQHEIDFRNKSLLVYLEHSPGGDVDAALKIGRIVRNNEGNVSAFKCFS